MSQSDPDQPVYVFVTPFEQLPKTTNDIDELFLRYNEYAKNSGFKMRKSRRSTTKEECIFFCTVGHTPYASEKPTKSGKRRRKHSIFSGYQGPACPVKVLFQQETEEGEWKLFQVEDKHNHDADSTLLTNEVIFDIDNFVTGKGGNTNLSEVKTYLEGKYQRGFSVATLAHHLSQRYRIREKGEAAVSFGEAMKRSIRSSHQPEGCYFEIKHDILTLDRIAFRSRTMRDAFQ